jgi:methylenetetrahydrofolate--tRNA-(uracil-5-)-methyltransferase
VQLRQDNLAGTLYNLVGFQTNLTFPEQRRVLRMIPGLEKADFERYGQMHRNTFINSPAHLQPTLQCRGNGNIFFAGQISGVEGYVGNIATGYLAGWNAARLINGQNPVVFPQTTMLGALCHYITNANPADFQPMKANYGLLPGLQDSDMHEVEGAIAYGEGEPAADTRNKSDQTEPSVRKWEKVGKRQRGLAYSKRGLADLASWLEVYQEK